jgi:catechol 2,3-dioxygenase-like lactoylglutathione lyase family enzyme
MMAGLLLATIPADRSAAAPVAPSDRVGIDLRRTTLVVQDIENSLRFYRDALGMSIVYDNIIRTPRSAPNDASAERSLRLVFLQANDDLIGMVGLMQYYKPLKTTPPRQPAAFSIGTNVLLFNTSNLADRFEAAKRVPGVEVIEPPIDTSYPGYGGVGTIPVRVSTLRDPDGFVVELNQLLVDKPR